jgi:hypothetical protein
MQPTRIILLKFLLQQSEEVWQRQVLFEEKYWRKVIEGEISSQSLWMMSSSATKVFQLVREKIRCIYARIATTWECESRPIRSMVAIGWVGLILLWDENEE